MPTPCLDKAVHAQGEGGGDCRVCWSESLVRGVKPNSDDLSEGVGGPFGRLILFDTHSKAHDFTEEVGGRMQIGV